ncbi:MAG: uracil-DNA glycosylase [Akkermansiaceae bacterium]|nr:uracil-DNA glycosylase [Akkermansiaceae bacterium]
MVIKTLLRDYLQARIAGGELRVPVDEAARMVLRGWMQAAKQGRQAARSAAAAAPPENDEPEDASQMLASLRRSLSEPRSSEAEEDEEPDQLFFRPGGRNAEEAWKLAASLLVRWDPLRQLGTLRDTPVWGEGSRRADIMFVGDAPNYYDEQAGRPFCGEAGAKLDGMLKAMGLSRRAVYITHLVKFRPKIARQTFNNRPPSKDEIRLSTPVLEFETRLVQPKVIVALGVIAARGLLQRGELPLTAYQELPQASFIGVPVVVTHHPSYLLRTADLAERRRLWEEMLRVMEIAHLPISDKQRRYFLK